MEINKRKFTFFTFIRFKMLFFVTVFLILFIKVGSVNLCEPEVREMSLRHIDTSDTFISDVSHWKNVKSEDEDWGMVGKKGNQFVVNDQPFYVNGFNAYWLMVFAVQESTRIKVTEVFQEAASVGLTVCRTWAFNDGGWMALQRSPSVYDEVVFKANRETKYWMRREVSTTHEELSRWLKDENASGVGATTVPLEIVNLAIDESEQSFPTTEWASMMDHNEETQQETAGAQSRSPSSTPARSTSQKKRKRQSKFSEVAQEMCTMRMEIGKMIEASLISNDIEKEKNELEKIKNEIEKGKNDLEKEKNDLKKEKQELQKKKIELEKEKNELSKRSLMYPMELDALLRDLRDDIGSEIALQAIDYFIENPNSLPIFVNSSRPNQIQWLIRKFG